MYQLGYDSLILWNSQADEYHKPKVECKVLETKEAERVDLTDANWVIMFVWNSAYFRSGYS